MGERLRGMLGLSVGVTRGGTLQPPNPTHTAVVHKVTGGLTDLPGTHLQKMPLSLSGIRPPVHRRS